MSICNVGCFSFWFRERDFGSDCASSWTLLALESILKQNMNVKIDIEKKIPTRAPK